MSKRILPTWAEAHDGSQSHLSFAVGVEFSRKLRELLEANGLTASDLARKIWGDSKPTPAGFVSAKNRDRISKYLAGKTLPDASTLALLAGALNAKPRDLAPQVVGKRLEREHPEIRMTVIAGHHDRVHLTLNAVMDLSTALKITALMRTAQAQAPGRRELREREKPMSAAEVKLIEKHIAPVRQRAKAARGRRSVPA